MHYSHDLLDKESNYLNKNTNDLLEKTNFISNIQQNNNLSLSSINNLELNSLNISFSDCDGFNLDCFNYIKKDKYSSPNENKNIDEERIISNENHTEQNILGTKSKIKKYNIKDKEKIFDIKKCIKLGRKKKHSAKIGKHDKFHKDNLIRKFKVHLLKNIYNFVNSCFLINANINAKQKINVIKKLSSFKIKAISKEDNIKWLDSKLKKIFSENVSSKLTHCQSNFNQNLIQRIYEKGEEKKVIQILEMKVRDIWNIYINNSDDENFIGFKTLKDDLNYFEQQGESKEYINEYKNICVKFEDIFNIIKSRKRRLSMYH